MAFQLKLNREAEIELDERVAQFEKQEKGLGLAFLVDFLELNRRLVTTPELFSVEFYSVRKADFKRFPFSLYFIIEQGVVTIYSILPRQSSPDIFRKRGFA